MFACPAADAALRAGAGAAGMRTVDCPGEAAARDAAAAYGRALGTIGVFLAGGTADPSAGAASAPVAGVLAVAGAGPGGPGPAGADPGGPGPGDPGQVGSASAGAVEISDPRTASARLAEALAGARIGGARICVRCSGSEAAPSPLAPPPSGAAPSEGIAEAALLLSLAARPVIWAGGGVVRSRAFEELAEVASLLCAPVVTSISGKGAISSDHSMAVGSLAQAPDVARLLDGADAALVVGSSLSNRSTKKGQLPLPMQLFHVDVDSSVPARRYPVRAGITGDARAVLESLVAELRAVAIKGLGAARDAEAQATSVSDVRDAACARLHAGMQVELALGELRRGVPADVATVWDAAAARWAVPLFPTPVPGCFHPPRADAEPGSSLATALGVAAGGTPVVAVASAAELLGHAPDLAAIAVAGLPVVVVTFDGPDLGGIWAAPDAPDLRSPLPAPAVIATGSGMPVESVRDLGGLAGAVKHALAHGNPILVVVGR